MEKKTLMVVTVVGGIVNNVTVRLYCVIATTFYNLVIYEHPLIVTLAQSF